ncbi:hypothetical protein IPM44_03365 [bacterium]|nr:MAG: hypothetical protein IPM44_03365 [bacterium]
MRKILVIALSLTIFVALAGCGNAANMTADFPCDYSAQVDEFTTGDYDPMLGDVIDATYPDWYASSLTAFMGEGDYRSEWGRLILARNGLSKESQIEPGSSIKIPARCEDLGGEDKSSD